MQNPKFLTILLVALTIQGCAAVADNTKASDMKKVELSVLGQENPFELIGNEWMLITAGTKDSFNTMTASWGGFGILWSKNVATIYVRPSRYTHDFIENADRLSLSFFPGECRKALQICGSRSGRDCDKVAEAGLKPVELESGVMTFSEARLVLECRKLYKSEMVEENFIDKGIFQKWYNPEDGAPHTIYILEIENIYENN